jgi:hypothetical protein
MRFITYLQEEYIGSIEGVGFGPTFKGGHAEIFMNPTNKEIRDAANQSSGPWKNMVRFIADFTNKDLYVFKADTLHVNVEQELKSMGKMENGELNWNTIWAVAEVKSGKLSYYSSDNLHYTSHVLTMDDAWTSKWFIKPIIKAFLNK